MRVTCYSRALPCPPWSVALSARHRTLKVFFSKFILTFAYFPMTNDMAPPIPSIFIQQPLRYRKYENIEGDVGVKIRDLDNGLECWG